jgi:hypothetical protein
MDADDANALGEVKKSSDAATDPEAVPEIGAEAALAGEEVEPAAEPEGPGHVLEPTTATVNTTGFPFLPDSGAGIAFPDRVDLVADMEKTKKRDLRTTGFLYDPEEANEKRWKGTYILSAGASAVASLWVRYNATNHVERVSIF